MCNWGFKNEKEYLLIAIQNEARFLFDSAYLECLFFFKLKDVQQSILFTLENNPVLFPRDLKSISEWNAGSLSSALNRVIDFMCKNRRGQL